ncbi:hypothetical protein P2W49_07205 [Yersinia intermedia]|nr:hypothetical protein P2W49_07205 [Yersinia intermedia]
MTKKKELHELKPRGRKEKVHQNNDLRSHLAGVRNLNQLTAAARKVIQDAIAELTEAKGSKKGMVRKNILFLITSLGDISLAKMKILLDESPLFDNDNYGESRVKEYKAVVTTVSKALSEMMESGIPVRVDDPRGASISLAKNYMRLQKCWREIPRNKSYST